MLKDITMLIKESFGSSINFEELTSEQGRLSVIKRDVT